ncbi:MAG: aminoglycoside phosphotransferase family protein [Oscillospiraceae bacterium]|nr:aminoglycoside phosphotransferase family protein [Oscillospiraceae bacterium]
MQAILRCFAIGEGFTEFPEARELTDGHINNTYLLEARGERTRRFVLQKINTFVFKRPVELMENIVRVTGYIRQRIAAGEFPGQGTLTVFPTPEGRHFHVDGNGAYWRCYNYVEDSYSLQAAGSERDAFCAGKAFGAFQRMLEGFPIAALHETIPDFHDTAKRYEALERAISEDAAGRGDEVEAEIAFARARKADAGKLLALAGTPELPLRVTHNDTKLNNVLFDCATREPVCVVDLDTIMPGLSLYDYGDSLRFLGSTAAEDERDLRRVRFSMPLFRAYTQGYLGAAAGALTATEKRLLPFSIRLMTYECGMRFLTDYLNGDKYFRIRRPDDNLARCRTQFALVEEMEALLPEMEAFVAGIKL